MADLVVKNLTKNFGENIVIPNLNMEVKDKEFFVMLGHPGAGKTTIIRLICGLEKLDGGEICLDGTVINDLHPCKRDIALIFQNLALYPKWTVYNNIAFNLKEAKLPRAEIKKRVEEVSKRLKIEDLLNRTPATLSGGERQRVAIGRALVRRPKIFIMDEPLTDLDALLRWEMRAELKRLKEEINQTILFSTPDPIEAVSMADRIAVIDQGKIQQCGTAEEVYDKPSNKFVAGFVGSSAMNFIDCTLKLQNDKAFLQSEKLILDVTDYKGLIEKKTTNSDLILGIRPENITFSDTQMSSESIEGKVDLIELLGVEKIIFFKINEKVLRVRTPTSREIKININDKKWINIPKKKIYLFDKKTEKNIL